MQNGGNRRRSTKLWSEDMLSSLVSVTHSPKGRKFWTCVAFFSFFLRLLLLEMEISRSAGRQKKNQQHGKTGVDAGTPALSRLSTAKESDVE